MIKNGITLLYSKADAVIALSRKSKKQLEKWQYNGYRYEVTLLPNGVDALPRPTKKRLADFYEQFELSERDEIFGFVGRLAEEKNLAILIKAFEKVGKLRPRAKLLFVGDFEYRKKLEELAAVSKFGDRIVFTGALPREELGVVYAALDVFVFPSLKDTQGWVLHEAAHAGLPIVLIDKDLSEVVIDGKNGYLARNNATDVARKVTALLRSPTLRAKFGEQSKILARNYSEKGQAKKLIASYKKIIATKTNES
jgi:glycosyltransferase involved in cell wall biosynthesis